MKQKKVLFVDDDECVLSSLRRGLADEPYEALFAHGASEAVSLLRKHAVHVLVTDLRMPDMSGLDLLEIVGKEQPAVTCLILSGQPQLESSEASSIVRGIHQGDIFAFVAKPWDLDGQLKGMVRQALDRHELCAQGTLEDAPCPE